MNSCSHPLLDKLIFLNEIGADVLDNVSEDVGDVLWRHSEDSIEVLFDDLTSILLEEGPHMLLVGMDFSSNGLLVWSEIWIILWGVDFLLKDFKKLFNEFRVDLGRGLLFDSHRVQ